MSTNDYYNEVCDTVHATYPLLAPLYKLEIGSEEFIQLFQQIERSYNKFNAARIAYYKLLKEEGGDSRSCWLTDEFENGLSCLGEEYTSIENVIQEYKYIYGINHIN